MDIDVILGMDWLSACKGVIKYTQRSVFLTTLSGEIIEYGSIKPTPKENEVDPFEGMNSKNGKEGCEILDVNVED
jgi:hypothetical protein